MAFQLTFGEFPYQECITDIIVILCVFFNNRRKDLLLLKEDGTRIRNLPLGLGNQQTHSEQTIQNKG